MRLLLSCLGWLVLPACQVVFPLGRDSSEVPDGAPADGVPTDAPPDVAPIDVGLILHLAFDEQASLEADELGHEVTCLGSCGQQTDDPHGGNRAIALGSCLSVTSAPDLEPTALSIMLWARQAKPPMDAQTLIARMNGVGQAAFIITRDPTNLSFTISDLTAGADPATDDQWHHVGVVFDGFAMTLYLDGQPAPSPTHPAAPTYPVNDPITIGCRTTSTTTTDQQFVGDLSDVRIYKRPLMETEVKVLAKP